MQAVMPSNGNGERLRNKADWLTRGLVTALICMLGWYGVGFQASLKAHGVSLTDLTLWRAETSSNRWTATNQAEFQARLFEEIAAERRGFYGRLDALLEKIHGHESSAHPPERVEKRIDLIATDVAAIKAIVESERQTRRSGG